MSILGFSKKRLKRAGRGDEKKKRDKPEAKKKLEAKGEKEKVSKKVSREQNVKLDLQPLVTEKGVILQEDGFVVFRVPEKATKSQIKQVVRARFKVEPIVVRTMRMVPKKRRRGSTEGRTAGWKKAYVKVNDVQKIVTGP
jgi:large subunit ribosomal protein L23